MSTYPCLSSSLLYLSQEPLLRMLLASRFERTAFADIMRSEPTLNARAWPQSCSGSHSQDLSGRRHIAGARLMFLSAHQIGAVTLRLGLAFRRHPAGRLAAMGSSGRAGRRSATPHAGGLGSQLVLLDTSGTCLITSAWPMMWLQHGSELDHYTSLRLGHAKL